MIGKLQGKYYAERLLLNLLFFTVDAGTSVFLMSAQKHAEVIVHVRNRIVFLFAFWC